LREEARAPAEILGDNCGLRTKIGWGGSENNQGPCGRGKKDGERAGK